MLRRGLIWLPRLLLVAIALLALFITLTPQGRTGFHTALFVSQTLEVPSQASILVHRRFPAAGGALRDARRNGHRRHIPSG